MIDFHNHILPLVDDGSTSIDMSLSMLEYAREQGITDVVNTVHFQHPKVEGEDISYNRIKNEINILQNILKQNGISINIHIGSEVFFMPGLLKLIDNPLATIGKGKYMLIEFQIDQLPEDYKKQLFELKMGGVTPIIAHPERYKPVQDNVNIVAEWLAAGCIIQVDAGSPLGYFGKRSKITSEKILKNGWCQILGSDSHDNRKRNFCLKESIQMIQNFVDYDTSILVNDNPKAVIEGLPMRVDFEYFDEDRSDFFTRLKDRLGLI